MSEIQPAFVLPVLVVAIKDGVRREAWRATLRTYDERVIWRCDCGLPHRTRDAAWVCGRKALRKRQAHSGQRIEDRGPIANAILSRGE